MADAKDFKLDPAMAVMQLKQWYEKVVLTNATELKLQRDEYVMVWTEANNKEEAAEANKANNKIHLRVRVGASRDALLNSLPGVTCYCTQYQPTTMNKEFI